MSSVIDDARVRRVLGTDALARVRERLTARLRRSGELDGLVVVPEPTPDERAAVDALFGRRPTSGRLTINLTELDRLIRNAGLAPSLVDAIELLEGPIVAARDAALAMETAWSDFEASLPTTVVGDPPWAMAWISELLSTGLLRRLSRGASRDARRWFELALHLLRRTPFADVRVAQLAADVCGDGHALDEGEPLGTLLVHGAAHSLGVAGLDVPRRDILAKVGIVVDDLSAPVLVLNLRGASTGLLATTLNRYADAGEPLHTSLRQILRENLTFDLPRGHVVYACENPTILAAAADALGASAHPLICTSGQARSALRELLRRLRIGGAQVRYHGDFDWPGVTIARGLYSRDEAVPWRMGSEDYAAAAGGPALDGKPIETPWDASLSTAMVKRGVAVHEETVLNDLLADLRGGE